MQKIDLVSPGGETTAERRRHRMRLLGALGGICRRLERLQPAGDARLACRDVAEGLRQWLEREAVRPGRRND